MNFNSLLSFGILLALSTPLSASAIEGKPRLFCNGVGTGPERDRLEWNREAGTVEWMPAGTSERLPLVTPTAVDGTTLPLSECTVTDTYIPGVGAAPDRYSLYVRCGSGHQVGLNVTDGDMRRGFYMLRLEPVRNDVERRMRLLAACE